MATDAALDGAEARRVAALGQLGLAAALSPPHLSVDGDALFCLATGSLARAETPPVDALGLAAADCVAEAIVRAIRTATALGGLPRGAISSAIRTRSAEAAAVTGRVIPFPSRAPEPGDEPEFEELTRVRDQAEALVVRGSSRRTASRCSSALTSRPPSIPSRWAIRARCRSSCVARR